MGKKIFRFIMGFNVGFCFVQAIVSFSLNAQWGLVFLTVMILALGLAILICVWDLIDYRKDCKK